MTGVSLPELTHCLMEKEESKLRPAASAAYLNNAVEPTAYSVRYAPASGSGSPRALGYET